MRVVLLLSLLSFQLYGQNLVLNPSFEFGNTCKSQSPNSILPADFIWWEPGSNSSVDIFSYCNGMAPMSERGGETPKHGSSYIGCVLKDKYSRFKGYREYAQSELRSPLIKSKHYLLSYYCSNMEGYSIEIKNVDIGFTSEKSNSLIQFSMKKVINPFEKLKVDYPVMDGWTHKSIVYEATGNEKYIIIGNFASWIQLKKRRQKYSKFGNVNRAYYLYDDISIIEIPENYLKTRSDSTQIISDVKWINQPRIGDSILLRHFTFDHEQSLITKSTDTILIHLAKYLTINPFLVFKLTLDVKNDAVVLKKNKLLTSREANLIARFEELGVSSNRIHLEWRTNNSNGDGIFSIIGNIDAEIFK